jgi:hypothetical protein
MRLPRLRIWQTVALGLVAGIFVVGLLATLRTAGSLVPPSPLFKNQGQADKQGQVGQVTSVTNAKFNYLIPGNDATWTFDSRSPVYDQTTAVVKYAVPLKFSGNTVTVSQQKLPPDFKDRSGAKFKAFMDGMHPVRVVDAGRGSVYFLPALQNGAPANGADTVIFVTDDVLLFGKTGSVIGFDGWTKLMATMHPHS